MTAEEPMLREEICRWARSLFERGLTGGSSGNISVKLEDGGFLATPTNSCFGFLDPERLSRLDGDLALLDGDPPTKELPLHQAFYDMRPGARAVVHLHAPHATALSCRTDLDAEDAIPPITPYAVMRLGRVAIIPYFRPGAREAYSLVASKARDHAALLLANHGPITAGPDLRAAMVAIEELEETARLLSLTAGHPTRLLSAGQVAELNHIFPLR
jgi:3-dehydro-4-phosphotetronate decarboxylase